LVTLGGGRRLISGYSLMSFLEEEGEPATSRVHVTGPAATKDEALVTLSVDTSPSHKPTWFAPQKGKLAAP